MASDLSPIDRQHLTAAMGWLELGDYLEANAKLEEIDPLFRAHPEVFVVRFGIYAKAQEWDRAADIAKVLLTFDPKNASYWLKLATAKRHGEGVAAAYRVLQEAREKVPADIEVPYQLACLAVALGQIATAEHHLKQAFALADLERQGQRLKLRALEDPDLTPLWKSHA